MGSTYKNGGGDSFPGIFGAGHRVTEYCQQEHVTDMERQAIDFRKYSTAHDPMSTRMRPNKIMVLNSS